jgi:hypothetical protein
MASLQWAPCAICFSMVGMGCGGGVREQAPDASAQGWVNPCAGFGEIQVGGAFDLPFPDAGVPDPLRSDAGIGWDGSAWDGALWDGGPLQGFMGECDPICGSHQLSCFTFAADAGGRMIECVECGFSP